MSDCGLIIGAGLGAGAGVVVAGGCLGYKILKKKNPKLLKRIAADVKQGFSEGFTKAYSKHAGTEASEKTVRPKFSHLKELTDAFCEGFDDAYHAPETQGAALGLTRA